MNKTNNLTEITPTCLCIVESLHKQRVFHNEPDYDSYSREDILNFGTYYDDEANEDFYFIDVMTKVYRYHLFFDLGKDSILVSIEPSQVAQFKHLPRKEIFDFTCIEEEGLHGKNR